MILRKNRKAGFSADISRIPFIYSHEYSSHNVCLRHEAIDPKTTVITLFQAEDYVQMRYRARVSERLDEELK